MATATKPPRFDTTTDSDADGRANPFELHDGPSERLNAGEQAALDQIEAGLRDDGLDGDQFSYRSDRDTGVEDAAQKITDKENGTANQGPQSGFYQPEKSNRTMPKSQAAKLIALAKKRGGIAGLMILFGVGGGLLASVFGPASMLINLMENLTLGNDSSSVVSERRLAKNLANMITKPGVCNSKKMKCKAGTISNKGLRRLAKHGVVAADAKGKPLNLKRFGYPDGNPEKFIVDGKHIKAQDLPGFLSAKENRGLAAKVLGRSGAFNMRFRVWSSKYLAKKFFSKFKRIKRNGGAATWAEENKKNNRQNQGSTGSDGEKKKTPSEEYRADDKINQSDIEESGNKAKAHADKKLKRARRAGSAYTLATGACIAGHIPDFVVGGVAGAQMAALIPPIANMVLSPGSQQKASGLDPRFAMTAAGMEFVGTMLTSRHKGSNGKAESALDSPLLLSAMGVNKNKVPLSEKFAPGLKVRRHPAIQAMYQYKDATKGACNVIMSDQAMYSAMAVDAAATALAAPTLIGGIVKAVGNFAISQITSVIVGEITKAATSAAVQAIFKAIVGDNDIANAKGREFGDMLGTSAGAFFAAANSAKHLPVLSKKGLSSFNQVRLANERQQREYDLASLSPFDTSSRHTFLGSLTFNLRQMMLQSGSYNNSFASIFSNIIRLPAMALSFGTAANASDNYSANYCGYAEDFGLKSEVNGRDVTPAVNFAGAGCTGFTKQQDDMGVEEAREILAKAGWIDESVDIEKEDDIEALVSKGYIKDNTPLKSFIESCSDVSSAEYSTNMTGCVLDESSTRQSTGKLSSGGYRPVVESENGKTSADTDFGSIDTADSRTLAAISVFLMDYQIQNSINGEDDEELVGSNQSNGASNSQTGENLDQIKMYYQSEEPWKNKKYGIGNIGDCGCAPTSMAAIISTVGNTTVDPEKMAEFFYQNDGQRGGEHCGSNWIWESKAQLFKDKFGITIKKVQPSAENASRGLSEGGLVLISVGGKTPFIQGGHIMFIRGKTADGKFLVGDPNKRSNTENKAGFAASEFHFGEKADKGKNEENDGTTGMWVITGPKKVGGRSS